MNNPLFKLSLGIEDEYGKIGMSGRHATLTSYQFYALFGYGDLMIARKDQFPSRESALIRFLHRFIEQEQKDNSRYERPSNEDEFIWEAEPWLIHTHGMKEIKELPIEKFLELYEFVHDMMTGFDTWIEEDKKKFIYNNYGILKDDEDYNGNYRRFNPLEGLVFQSCFSVINDEWKNVEYMGETDRFYVYLKWKYTAPQQT